MNLEQILKETLKSERSVLKTMEPMSRHTSLRIGGPASFYVSPAGEEDLAAVLEVCAKHQIPWNILGNGSNLLVSDKGFDGVVIAMDGFSYVQAEGKQIRAGAGALLSKAAHLALSHSLTGMEFAAGIPGSAGGALVMNAGAYGSEVKDILSTARLMTAGGEILVMDAEALELGYRTSCIPSRGYIVLEAVFSLASGDKAVIESRMKELASRRREKQPLEYPSAGSTFKRPEGHYAGKLIEEAGLRGYQVGGAQVSEKHCGFVINRGGATAADVMGLCSHVRETVKENAGVELEMEVRRWGQF